MIESTCWRWRRRLKIATSKTPFLVEVGTSFMLVVLYALGVAIITINIDTDKFCPSRWSRGIFLSLSLEYFIELFQHCI